MIESFASREFRQNLHIQKNYQLFVMKIYFANKHTNFILNINQQYEKRFQKNYVNA